MQLRRSFRFNEYGKISKLNPPQGPIGKVRAAVAALVLSYWRCVAWVAVPLSWWLCWGHAAWQQGAVCLANLLIAVCSLLSSTPNSC